MFIHILQAGPLECLKDVALKILQDKVATVPIIQSSSEDGSFPQLLHLASLSEILKCKLLNLLGKHKWFGTKVWTYFQVYAGILSTVRIPCPFFRYQLVRYLQVHGCQNWGNPINSNLLCYGHMLLLAKLYLC